MGPRKAGRTRQAVRPVVEQANVGARAAEAREVPRAIHIGCDLEKANYARTKRDREGEECRLAAERPQARDPASGQHNRERGNADDPDEGRAPFVNQGIRPPRVRAQPGAGPSIEEPGLGKAAIDIEFVNDARGRSEEDCGKQGVQQPVTPRARATGLPGLACHGQKLRFV
jgi:hypothetical protein